MDTFSFHFGRVSADSDMIPQILPSLACGSSTQQVFLQDILLHHLFYSKFTSLTLIANPAQSDPILMLKARVLTHQFLSLLFPYFFSILKLVLATFLCLKYMTQLQFTFTWFSSHWNWFADLKMTHYLLHFLWSHSFTAIVRCSVQVFTLIEVCTYLLLSSLRAIIATHSSFLLNDR